MGSSGRLRGGGAFSTTTYRAFSWRGAKRQELVPMEALSGEEDVVDVVVAESADSDEDENEDKVGDEDDDDVEGERQNADEGNEERGVVGEDDDEEEDDVCADNNDVDEVVEVSSDEFDEMI